MLFRSAISTETTEADLTEITRGNRHAVRYPVRDVGSRGTGIRTRGVFRAFLEVGSQGGVLGNSPIQSAVDTRFILVGRLLLELILVVKTDQTNGQLVLHQHLVDVDRLTMGTEATEAELDAVGVLELRLLEIIINDTSGATEAEEQRVRALRNGDTIGVVGIETDVGEEVSSSPVRI